MDDQERICENSACHGSILERWHTQGKFPVYIKLAGNNKAFGGETMEKQDISSARRRLKCTNRKTRKRALKIIQQYKREKKIERWL